MKEQFACYVIAPPDDSYLDDFLLRESIAVSAEKAWERFCYPALRREGYEADGFKAKKVKVTIEVIE